MLRERLLQEARARLRPRHLDTVVPHISTKCASGWRVRIRAASAGPLRSGIVASIRKVLMGVARRELERLAHGACDVHLIPGLDELVGERGAEQLVIVDHADRRWLRRGRRVAPRRRHRFVATRRQEDLEARAAAGLGVDLHRAVVPADDAVDRGEPEAAAGCLRRIERIEDLRGDVRPRSCPGRRLRPRAPRSAPARCRAVRSPRWCRRRAARRRS